MAEVVVVVDREELTISKLGGVATTEVEGSVEHTVGVVVVVANEELTLVKLVDVIGRDIDVVTGGSVEDETELGD